MDRLQSQEVFYNTIEGNAFENDAFISEISRRVFRDTATVQNNIKWLMRINQISIKDMAKIVQHSVYHTRCMLNGSRSIRIVALSKIAIFFNIQTGLLFMPFLHSDNPLYTVSDIWGVTNDKTLMAFLNCLRWHREKNQ